MTEGEMRSLMAIGGKQYAEKIRKMDEALTMVLENPYGQMLGYYPPVYVVSKCFEFCRPYYLELEDANGFEKRINSSDFTNENGYKHSNGHDNDMGNDPSENNEIATFLKKHHPEDSPKIQKKSLSWFFGSSKKIDKTHNQNNGSSANVGNDKEENSLVKPIRSTDDVFYPCEGSDIDEDDDSDVEGEYTFYHDNDDADAISIGAGSMSSEKELTNKYEKELKIKLVENFVNDDTKEEDKKVYKKRGSLKRIFSKSKK